MRNFTIVSSEFVQILHTGRDHWVCISTIGCSPGIVKLFDSLFHDIVSQEVEDQAQSLLADSFKKLVYAPVQQQTNAGDCGLFAIAFAASLVFGYDPQDISFDTTRMRAHLVAYFEAGALYSISMFVKSINQDFPKFSFQRPYESFDQRFRVPQATIGVPRIPLCKILRKRK